jgi:hypothetical protein
MAQDPQEDPIEEAASRVLDPPNELYLVYGDIDEDCKHDDCDEVLWSPDMVFPADVRYVRADLAEITPWTSGGIIPPAANEFRSVAVVVVTAIGGLEVAYYAPLDSKFPGIPGWYAIGDDRCLVEVLDWFLPKHPGLAP